MAVVEAIVLISRCYVILKPDRNDDPDPEPNPNPEPKPDPQPDVETGTNLYIAAKCEQTALAQQNSVPVTITIGNKNSESAIQVD